MREIKRKDLKKREREAAALQYVPDEGAPRVIAAGKGHVAEKILETAEANLIPIHEDPELAHMLNLLNVGAEIPEELYAVVAQILIFVKDADSYFAQEKGRSAGR